MTQTTTPSTDEFANLIAKYRDVREAMNCLTNELIHFPWKKLSDEGLTVLATRACMLQEGTTVSRAYQIVRDYENSLDKPGQSD